MIWGKRRFEDADFGPYQDRLDKLALADARVVDQYCMVAAETDVAVADYYVGVPTESPKKAKKKLKVSDAKIVRRAVEQFSF